MQFLFYLKKGLKKRLWSIKLSILLLIISAVFALQAFQEASSLNIEQEKFKNMVAKVDATVEEEMQPHSSAGTESANSPTVHTPTILSQYTAFAQQNRSSMDGSKLTIPL